MTSDNEEWITLADIARRVGLTRARIHQLANDDPKWPVPRHEWRRIGGYYLLPWTRIAPYFRDRGPRRGQPPQHKKPT